MTKLLASGIPIRVVPPTARSEPSRAAGAPEPVAMDEVPADEGAELPVPERGSEIEDTEVIIDGVKLDSNSS